MMNYIQSSRESLLKKLYQERLCVLSGGWSSEREVSLRSGQAVYDSLQRQKFTVSLIDIKKLTELDSIEADRFILMLHGGEGEDGTVQKLLQNKRLAFTGSLDQACRLAMDKRASKNLFLKHGLPCPEYARNLNEARSLPFPIVRKPHSEGSSVGVSIIYDAEDLNSVEEDDRYFFESFVEGKEVTVGVLEKEDGPYALPILELIPKSSFYDYHAKYTKGQTRFVIPANLSSELTEKVQ